MGRAAAEAWPDAPIFCTGGLGRHAPSEARLMADTLQAAGVPPARLFLDEHSTDTLENVVAAAGFLKGRGLAAAIACTDDYHLPRVAMMLGAFGVTALPPPGLSAHRSRGARRLRMQLREAAAYPYDAAIILWRGRALRRTVAAASVRWTG